MTVSALHTCAAAPLDLGDGAPLPTQIELLPLGRFELQDRTGLQVTQNGQVTDAPALIARSLEMATGGAFPIDFDHGLDDGGTKDGRAAGWIMGLSVQRDRIVGDVEWSADGAAALAGKMYRYVSPTFYTEEATGEVLYIARAGLTNMPALPMLKRLAARSDASQPKPNAPDVPQDQLQTVMAQALGLDADATPNEIVAALLSRVAAAPPAAESGTGTVPMEAVVKYMSDQADARRLEIGQQKVTAAMQAGKLPPVMASWATELANTNPASFDAFMQTSPFDLASKSGIDGVPPGTIAPSAGSNADSITDQLGLARGSLNS